MNAQVQRFSDAFLPGAPIFFDTETTGLNPRKDTLVLLQLYQTMMPEPIVIDWRGAWPSWADALSEVFSESLLVAHNAKFDLSWLRRVGIKAGRVYCTQVAEQVLRGVGIEDSHNQGIELSLAGLTKQYGLRSTPVSKVEREWFYKELPKDINQPIPEAQIEYAKEDVRLLADIYTAQQQELEVRPGLMPVIELEMRVLPALVDVEAAGIRINVDGWREFIERKRVEAKGFEDEVLDVFGEVILTERIRKYDQEMQDYLAWEAAKQQEEEDLRMTWDCPAGGVRAFFGDKWGEFKTESMKRWREEHPNPGRPKLDTTPPNIGSPAQMLGAFKALGLPVPTQRNKQTGKTGDSLDSKLLAPYENQHPEIKTLIKYRKADKFVDSFGESLLVFLEGDRIHPEYNQIGASTGRMSCTRPNWQQIPSRGDGKQLRQCVIAAPGHKLLTADFSNIEMRILAEYSRDERLLDFFDRDADLHSEVARLMFGLSTDVNPKATDCPAVPGWTYRDVAKTINYGLVYGMSAARLSRTAMIPKPEAARLMKAYFDIFPGVVTWLETAKRFGWERKWSRTMLGRVRPYRVDMTSPKLDEIKARVERQSMNTPIQGTSADITKSALVRYFEQAPGLGHVVAIVHDELVVEVEEERAEEAGRMLAMCMDDAQRGLCRYDMKRPPRVKLERPEVHIADRWEK
jgi:DNA polymerase I